jgi:periplasmic divalent cation tolerance protein
MPQPEIVQVQVAHDDRDALAALLAQAVERRLAACGQLLGPMTSTFRWEGEVQEAQEWLGLLKTTAGRLDALVEFLAGAHGYELPEVLATPVAGGLRGYLDWVAAETGGT